MKKLAILLCFFALACKKDNVDEDYCECVYFEDFPPSHSNLEFCADDQQLWEENLETWRQGVIDFSGIEERLKLAENCPQPE